LSRAGEHQHRRVAACPHRLEHAEPVDAGQHQVEQQQVVLAVRGQASALDAVARDVDHVAVLRQALVQVVGQLQFVLDDQEAHARGEAGNAVHVRTFSGACGLRIRNPAVRQASCPLPRFAPVDVDLATHPPRSFP
jgi:hypothetical protein